MYKKGKTLFLTTSYPPNPSAAAVVHRQLLDQFDPDSFILVTAFFPGAKRAEVPKDIRRRFVYLSLEFFSSKVHRMLASFQRLTIPLFLRYYVARYKPARIVISYPDLYWLDICSAFAIKKNIPFVPYFHNTLVEGVYKESAKALAKKVQERVFGSAYNIAVMSEGMRDLYKRKYNLSSVAWEHIYPELPVPYNGPKEYRAHWSGDIYEINYKALARLNNAFIKMGMQFSISNGKTVEQLKAFGITGDHIKKVFYPKRADYLQQLNVASILLLALNYSDECTDHEDELATIFSTKTPEYLGSNSLIVYHGPRHYFLAQFILQNDCGIVIETRDEDELLKALTSVMENYDSHLYKIKNATKSLSIFNASLVAGKLIQTLDV